ncbi:hypothetical protein NEAUS03_2155 [Nematocida ausubeli]|nr:hypothetical protein NEAUS03_2155 [Nematocida ausubeli]
MQPGYNCSLRLRRNKEINCFIYNIHPNNSFNQGSSALVFVSIVSLVLFSASEVFFLLRLVIVLDANSIVIGSLFSLSHSSLNSSEKDSLGARILRFISQV